MELILFLAQHAVFGFGIALFLMSIHKSKVKIAKYKIEKLLIMMVYTVLSSIAGAVIPPWIATIVLLVFVAVLDNRMNNSMIVEAITDSLITYTLNILSVIVASIITYIIFFVIGKLNYILIMLGVMISINILLIFILNWVISNCNVRVLLSGKHIKYGLNILCIITILITKGIKRVDELDVNLIFALFLFVIVISILMACVWVKDKMDQLKREEEMQKSNSDLSGIVHKSRELIPALASKLKYLEDHAGESEEIAEELQNFRAEIEILSGEQAEEDRRNNMFMKTYEGSGFTVLDGMFQNRLAEAAKEDIDFDIIIRHPLNRLVREQNITQLALQRMIGDLISNAFRAVKKSERDDKSILFCAGYLTEDVYEIEIHDNADLFPIEILKHFGERGYTTGGTGNGIADILDTVDHAGASFCLEEYPPDSSLFTKRIAVCFDRAHRMKIITERKEELGEMERFVVM